jgi:hypothetical protein
MNKKFQIIAYYRYVDYVLIIYNARIINIKNIVAYRLKAELYVNRSGRPLLDNGSETGVPVSLSGWQMRSRDNAYIGRLFPM